MTHYTSSRWYQTTLGMKSAHGGRDYEQLHFGGKMVMQLHRWDVHNHTQLGTMEVKPPGNGVALWFQHDEFDEVLARIRESGAEIVEGPQVNSNANHREVWLRDPDGYIVVIAGAYGDVGTRRTK
ncbi:MAG: VOC family protein [Candidatus Nitrotoga sp.]